MVYLCGFWVKVYHPDSLEVVPRFDPACVSSLDQSHGDANEEKHLSLLHTEDRNVKKLLCLENLQNLIYDLIPRKMKTLVS